MLLLAAVSPLLLSLEKISYNDDFLQLSTRHFLLRKAVLGGEFPLWTPYLNGGFPSIADPEDPALSPFSLLTVIFGEIAGLKLIALLVFVAGCAAMFRFLREVAGVTPPGAAVGTVVFGLSGWFVTRLYSGNVNELYYFLVPLVLLCLEQFWSSGERRRGFYAAALLALIAMDGKATFMVVVLFLAAYSVGRAAILRRGKVGLDTALLFKFVAVAVAALAFSMVKIVPVLELFAAKGSIVNPVIDTHTGAYKDVLAFTYADLARGLVRPDTPNRAVSLYLGMMPLLLLAAGLLFRFGQTALWALLGALFSVLWAGPNSPVDIFRLLRYLPFFGTISQPHKYFDFFIVFAICVSFPLGFDAVVKALDGRPRISMAARLVLGAAAIIPLLAFTFPKYRGLYTSRPPELFAREFFQVKLPAGERSGEQMYFNAVQNVGTINWYGAILLPSAAEPRYLVDPAFGARANPAYKGESFCLKSGSLCQPVYFGANRLKALISTGGPDRVVFNQNYDARWRSTFGEVENYGGLLSVAITAALSRQVLVLEYSSGAFYAGALFSVLSFFAAICLCFPVTRFFMPSRRYKDVSEGPPGRAGCFRRPERL